MPLIGAGVLFSVFVLNVVLGAKSDAAFFGDVGEMLLLLGTSILFVVGILKQESAAKEKAAQSGP
jgi:hypothetical protein